MLRSIRQFVLQVGFYGPDRTSVANNSIYWVMYLVILYINMSNTILLYKHSTNFGPQVLLIKVKDT